MPELFYLLLGAVFFGYFALAGYDYGVGALLTAVARTDQERRMTLSALGPFFLGNEVWLVAGLGLLIGAFPMLEGALLSALYPVATPLIATIVIFTGAVQLRSRFVGARVACDWIIVGSAIATAFGWGGVLGFMLQGFPLRLSPLPVFAGAATMSVFVMHGAGLLSLRAPAVVRARARRVAVVMGHAALAMTAATALTAVAFGGAIHQWPPAAALTVALLFAVWFARRLHSRRRHGIGFAATVPAAGLPVVITGVAMFPYMFVDAAGSLTVTDSTASGPTLDFLAYAVLPLLPLLVAFQFATWWLWRRAPERPIFY